MGKKRKPGQKKGQAKATFTFDQEKMIKALEGLAAKLKEKQPEISAGLRKAMAQANVGEGRELESAPVPLIRGELTAPTDYKSFADRHVWYWRLDEELTVMATYMLEVDAIGTKVAAAKPGVFPGDWVIDVLGVTGGAMYGLDSFKAHWVASAILSAIAWENEWRKDEATNASVQGL